MKQNDRGLLTKKEQDSPGPLDYKSEDKLDKVKFKSRVVKMPKASRDYHFAKCKN